MPSKRLAPRDGMPPRNRVTARDRTRVTGGHQRVLCADLASRQLLLDEGIVVHEACMNLRTSRDSAG